MSNFVNLLDIVYPVGSVFISNTSISPADSIGGTWTQLEDGSFICQGTLEETGGTNSYTLTMSQMPRHNHSIRWGSAQSDGKVDIYWVVMHLQRLLAPLGLETVILQIQTIPYLAVAGKTLLTTDLNTGLSTSISAQPSYMLGSVA